MPRPVWERRPYVSRVYALWRTLMDVTFHPRRFFDSIQQPNRLRRSITWHIGPIVLFFVVVYTYALMDGWGIGFFPSSLPRRSYPSYLFTLLMWHVYRMLPAVCLVELPLVATLLVADVILWKDRRSYRLFFKGAQYTITVYMWLAIAICGIGVLLNVLSSHIERLSSYVQSLYSLNIYSWPWTNWLLAGAITWQYVLIFRYVLGRRFATLEPPRPGRKTMLSLVVVGAWLTGMHLVFFDFHMGFRFATARWAWELVQ